MPSTLPPPSPIGISLRCSGLFLLCLWIIDCSFPCSCYGYILPQQQQRSPFVSSTRTRTCTRGSSNTRKRGRTRATKPLFIGTSPTGADYFGEELASSTTDNLSFEAAIGHAQHASEYERDAEFYRKRNEDYSNSLAKHALSTGTTNAMNVGIDVDVDADDVDLAPTASASAHSEHFSTTSSSSSSNPHQITTAKATLKASFDHVEKSTFSLLTGRPLVALSIFCAAGILVAYLSGFFFLEGYIENWNPVENDQVPYWEDAEIHTITRVVE